MSRKHVEASAVARAAPEAVWALVADATSYPAWGRWEGAGYARGGDAASHGVGAVRWLRHGRRTITEEILELDDERRLAYTVVSGMPVRNYRGEVTLTPVADGTLIDWSATWDGTLAGRIVRRKLRTFFPDVVARLAAASAEQTGQSPTPA